MLNNDENLIIKKKSLNGFIWNIVGSGGQQIFSLIVFMVLTRTLGAKEFGLIALASVFIDILMLASRAGLTEVIIQRNNISDLEKNTAFWSSLILGVVFSLALFLSSSILANGLKQPSIEPVIKWLAFLPFISALSTVQEGLIRKEFGFKALALRNISANIISGATSVILALTGFGILSLIIQKLISVCLLTGVLWWSSKWKPKFEFSFSESLAQLKFGSSLALSNILASGNQRIIDLIVGYMLGPVALGYLRIAWRGIDLMLEFSIRPISNITLSTFSALNSDVNKISKAYIRISQLTMLVAVPVFIGAALVAPELIRLLFGAKWEESIVPMQILSLSVLTFPVIYYKNNALIAIGESRQVINLNLIEFLVSSVVILITAQYGLIAAAIGNVLRVFLITPVILHTLHKCINLDRMKLFQQTLPIINASFWMVVFLSLVRLFIQNSINSIGLITIQIILGIFIYVFILIKFHNNYVFELIDSFYKDGKYSNYLQKFDGRS